MDPIELLTLVMAQKWEIVSAEKGDSGTIKAVLVGQSRNPNGIQMIPEVGHLDTLLRNLGMLRSLLVEKYPEGK